jgi:hypothetical protein
VRLGDTKTPKSVGFALSGMTEQNGIDGDAHGRALTQHLEQYDHPFGAGVPFEHSFKTIEGP